MLAYVSFPLQNNAIYKRKLMKKNNKKIINYSSWTEWSTIQGVIVPVISKSGKCKAQGQFEITELKIPF